MYDGSHSITFTQPDGSNGKNTWIDWFLIPTSRPTVSYPAPYTKFVEIPGMDGSYDISDYLTNGESYSDRSGSFEFVVDNDHADWLTIYQDVLLYLHGQKLRMILQDDSGYYYVGRFNVNEFKSDKTNSRIVIDYRVGPAKTAL